MPFHSALFLCANRAHLFPPPFIPLFFEASSDPLSLRSQPLLSTFVLRVSVSHCTPGRKILVDCERRLGGQAFSSLLSVFSFLSLCAQRPSLPFLFFPFRFCLCLLLATHLDRGRPPKVGRSARRPRAD